ncbi:hypothetical protein [Aeromonas bivalvium]|uniref:hypothetical protein n=1 Tax=Aeromonas bivalvium TaxID=440079 RepID=UPI003D19723D
MTPCYRSAPLDAMPDLHKTRPHSFPLCGGGSGGHGNPIQGATEEALTPLH